MKRARVIRVKAPFLTLGLPRRRHTMEGTLWILKVCVECLPRNQKKAMALGKSYWNHKQWQYININIKSNLMVQNLRLFFRCSCIHCVRVAYVDAIFSQFSPGMRIKRSISPAWIIINHRKLPPLLYFCYLQDWALTKSESSMCKNFHFKCMPYTWTKPVVGVCFVI